MNNTIEKRLEALEAQIKSAAESPIWIDGKDATIRVDVNGKRGKPVTFSSTYQAVRWLASQIDGHPHAAGSYSCDRLFELYRNADNLKEAIGAALEGRVINVHGIEYSADSWPGFLFGQLKTGGPADLKLWLLASGALLYFGTAEFRERWQTGEFTENDAAFMCACYAVFAWEKPGATAEDFWGLVVQVAGLKAAESRVEPATAASETRRA